MIGDLLNVNRDRDPFFAIAILFSRSRSHLVIAIWLKDHSTIAIAKFNDRDRQNAIFLAILADINIFIKFSRIFRKALEFCILKMSNTTFDSVTLSEGDKMEL